jgi:hypothetical protein
MFHKLIIAVILLSAQYHCVMAQKYPGKHKDSLLAYFIEDKTFYKDSDPAPFSTYFENKKQSFPWLYLDNLILGYGQDRFLIDPGYGANKASEHNCVTVRGHEQSDCATSYIRKAFEHETGFYLVCDIREAFPHTASHYNRHLLMIDDSHLLLIDDVAGTEERRLWVNGHFQTRYPTERTLKGWEINGVNETCKIDLLFDFGPQNEVEWDYMGPITKLVYKDQADRAHVVQPVLFSFKDVPYSYKYTSEGFSP